MGSSVLVAFKYDLDGGLFSINADRNTSFDELRRLWSEHSLMDKDDHLFSTIDDKALPVFGNIGSILPIYQFCLSIKVKIRTHTGIQTDVLNDSDCFTDSVFENATAPMEPEFQVAPQWIQESLTCPIHLDLFENPRCLPCGHIYCCGCLQQLLKDNKLKCPLCRTGFVLPSSGCSALPQIFVIDRLIKNISDCNKQANSPERLSCETTGVSAAMALPVDVRRQRHLKRHSVPRVGPIDKVAAVAKNMFRKRDLDCSPPPDAPVSNFEPYDIKGAVHLPVISVVRDFGRYVSYDALSRRLECVFKKKISGIWIHLATSTDSSTEETVILVRNHMGTTYFADHQGRRVFNSRKDRNPRLRRSSAPVFVPEKLAAVIDVDFQ